MAQGMNEFLRRFVLHLSLADAPLAVGDSVSGVADTKLLIQQALEYISLHKTTQNAAHGF